MKATGAILMGKNEFFFLGFEWEGKKGFSETQLNKNVDRNFKHLIYR